MIRGCSFVIPELIGIGGMALTFLTIGKPLLGIFTADLVHSILSPLLPLMTLAFMYGFICTNKDWFNQPSLPSWTNPRGGFFE